MHCLMRPNLAEDLEDDFLTDSWRYFQTSHSSVVERWQSGLWEEDLEDLEMEDFLNFIFGGPLEAVCIAK